MISKLDSSGRTQKGPDGAYLTRESWRVFTIMAEFVEGFEQLSAIPPSVSVFGSARLKEGHPWYDLTRDISEQLSNAGFAVVTGGGPGLMDHVVIDVQAELVPEHDVGLRPVDPHRVHDSRTT